MFDKSDDKIKSLRNLTFNNDYIENQFEKNNNETDSFRINEHLTDTLSKAPKYISRANSQTEFKDSFDFNEDESRNILNSANIFTKEQIHEGRFNQFARYGILDPYNEHSGSREYLFFSKPDLHIFDVNSVMELYEPLKQSAFFCNAKKQFPESLLSLQQTFNNTKTNLYPNKFNVNNKFIPLLSNQVSSSLDLPTITATETQNNTNLYQIGTSYRDGSELSDCNADFSLTFKDTKFLDVYMFFKAYDEYRREEYLREIRPTKYSYIENKVSSKEFSIWKLIVNETNGIIFFAKIVAAYPMNVPRDVMSNFDGGIALSLNFKGQWIRDMNPSHLNDLNHLTELSLNKTSDEMTNYINSYVLPLYDTENWVPNTKWAKYPYIIKSGNRPDATESEGDFYRLIWIG